MNTIKSAFSMFVLSVVIVGAVVLFLGVGSGLIDPAAVLR